MDEDDPINEGAAGERAWPLRIAKSGSWLYDHAVEKPVDVVGLGYDYWYEVGRADGRLEADEERAPPGDGGLLYYVRFRQAGETASPTWVDSDCHPTVEGAMAEAESKAPSPIHWD